MKDMERGQRANEQTVIAFLKVGGIAAIAGLIALVVRVMFGDDVASGVFWVVGVALFLYDKALREMAWWFFKAAVILFFALKLISWLIEAGN